MLLFIIISPILKQLIIVINLCRFTGSETSPKVHTSQEDQDCSGFLNVAIFAFYLNSFLVAVSRYFNFYCIIP